MTKPTPPKFTSAHVLATTAVVFIPLAILLAKALAPLFALAAVSVLGLEFLRRHRLPLTPWPVTCFLSALAAWSLLSWIWSIAPHETAKTGFSLASTLFGGAVLIGRAARLDRREWRLFENGLIAGGAVGFALIAFEFVTDARLAQSLYGLAGKQLQVVDGRHTAAMNAGLAATVLFFWSWQATVRARYPRIAAGIAVAAAVGLILLGQSDAIPVSLLVGAAVFGAALVLPRVMPWIMAAVISVGVLAAPLIPDLLPNPLAPDTKFTWLSMSAAHRIVIWKNTVPHINNNPVIGAGFDTARALYSGKDRVVYHFPRAVPAPMATNLYEPIPLHPHNGVLQVWLELGAIGALIALGLLLVLLRVIASIEAQAERAGALAMLGSAITIATISFGAWQSWWLASLLLTSAFLVARVMSSYAQPNQ